MGDDATRWDARANAAAIAAACGSPQRVTAGHLQQLLASIAPRLQPSGHFSSDVANAAALLGVRTHPRLVAAATSDAMQAAQPALDEASAALARPPAASIVTLRGWQLDTGSALALAAVLPLHRTIHSVTIADCAMEGSSIELLASVLSRCSNVQALAIEFNPLDHEAAAGAWPALLAGAPSGLKSLSLRANAITDAVAARLLGTLRENRSLVALNLWGNALGPLAEAELAQMLCINRTLQAVSVARNPGLSLAGLDAVLKALVPLPVDKAEAARLKAAKVPISVVKGVATRDANTVLRVLDLAECDVAGLAAAATATLRANNSLSKLIVACNNEAAILTAADADSVAGRLVQ